MSEQPKYQAYYEWLAALMSPRGPAPTTRLVLVGLSLYANPSLEAYPSQREIAKRIGRSERTVRVHLDLAELEGWITRRRKRTPGSKWSHTVYTLRIPELHDQVAHAA